MSVIGPKRTSPSALHMSDYGSKADIWGAGGIAGKKNPSCAERRAIRKPVELF
jgi:hypothetical protein